MLLNKHNFAVADFVSKEKSRYTLQAIHVSDKGTCATDGHQLVRISLPGEKSERFPSIEGVTPTNGHVNPFLLDVTAAKQIGKAVPKSRNLPILNHAVVGEATDQNACIAVTDLENPQVFRPRTPSGNFPNVDAVIPKRKPIFEIAVNASLLAGIVKAASAFTSEPNNDVLLRFYGKDEVVSVHSRNSETEQTFLALLMPLRMSEPQHYGVTNAKQRGASDETQPTQ